MEEGVNGPKLNGFSLIQGCMTCVGELHVNDALTDAFLNVHKPSVNEGVNDDADSVCVESNASANVPRVGHSASIARKMRTSLSLREVNCSTLSSGHQKVGVSVQCDP